MSAELAAFYRKCLDEVEAAAKGTGASAGRWQPSTQHDDEEQVAGYSVVAVPSQNGVVAALGLDADTGLGVVTHVALHDPRRALWEVEAGRAVLAALEKSHGRYASGEDAGLEIATECLAAVFRDRPGYKHEWSP